MRSPNRPILITGGAEGADEAFIHQALKLNLDIISYSFENHKIAVETGRKILSKEELESADPSLERILGDRFYESQGHTLNLWRRNRFQFLNSLQAFVVVQDLELLFDFTSQRVPGSGMVPLWYLLERENTSESLFIFDQSREKWVKPDAIGSLCSIHVAYFNRRLKTREYRWAPVENNMPIIPLGAFAGIGTRELSVDGRKAILELFKNVQT